MYFRARRRAAGEVSLDDPLEADADGSGLTRMELISDEEDFISRLDIDIKARRLRQIFGSLEEREQQVLRMRYGLDNRLPMPQREVGRRLGISRSYVSRIEKHAIEKLREQFKK